jgi:H(+)-translocating pyrophosphatase
MGADLFGSFAESSCAAMVIAAQSPDLFKDFTAICFPLIISSAGILVCIVTSFVATHIQSVNQKEDIEKVLKYQLVVSTVLMTPVAYALCYGYLPATFSVAGTSNVKNYQIFFCLLIGLWSGLIIGYTTEYYTSNAYSPVQEVADSCRTGAATNVIYGLALGYKSVIVPVFCISLTIYVGFKMADMYGVAMGALGILSTLSIGLTIDAYGPICDNAGGVAEMAGLDPEVRDITDALDAAGNTTAAIGKGFAIGSAALVSLALFGAFVTTVGLQKTDVSVLNPLIFAGALIGAMLPYWFSALTMKSVGIAAKDMVLEVGRQFAEKPALRDINHPDHKTTKPDYRTCVAISTKAALKEMMAPGALVMLSPILMGFLIGVDALAGMLVGALISGVQVAISASNTGGAWDNAKKFIENADNDPESDPSKRTFGKGKPMHAAAVIGDTIGDPLKDTSGPSLNILIKLMAIISLVFGPAFPSLKDGGYLFQLFNL